MPKAQAKKISASLRGLKRSKKTRKLMSLRQQIRRLREEREALLQAVTAKRGVVRIDADGRARYNPNRVATAADDPRRDWSVDDELDHMDEPEPDIVLDLRQAEDLVVLDLHVADLDERIEESERLAAEI